MDKQVIIEQLAELPQQIGEAENLLIERHNAVQSAKEALIAKEDELILAGSIDGKNAEIRAAQMRQFTLAERKRLQDAENAVTKARVGLACLNNRMSTLKAIAGLLKGAE